MPKRIDILSFCLYAVLSAVLWPDTAAASGGDEYSVKAAFIYNIARFTQWPEANQASQSDFRLCVYGNDPFGPALDTLAGKAIKGSPVSLSRLKRGSSLDDCDAAFISDSERLYLKHILDSIGQTPILTISDIPQFAEAGGMVELAQSDNRMVFDINVGAAEFAQLKISSQLLGLARKVIQAP